MEPPANPGRFTGSIYIGFIVAAVIIFFGTLLAVFAIPHTRLRKPAM